MKTFKRISAFFLAMIMAVLSMGTTAFAVEPNEDTSVVNGNIVDVTYNDDGSIETTYELEITQDKENGYGIALLSNPVDQTFTMTDSHRGSTRTYNNNYLDFKVDATDSNGNAVSTILAIQLYSKSNNLIREEQVWANGNSYSYLNIPITSGSAYYFKYLIAYGTQRTLRVHMVITPHN